MGLKIYLIRHGETDFNKQSLEWGQDDQIPLNENGIAQSKKLAERLKKIKFDKLFSSDLKRAMQTAEEVGRLLGVNIIADKRLREYDPGKADPSSEKWKKEYDRLLNSGMIKYDIRPFGGENIWDLIKRAGYFLDDIQKENGTIGIIAHSGVNSVFINLTQNKKKENFIKIKQDNTCINLLELSDGKWEIKSINDSEHINEVPNKKEVYKDQEEIKKLAKQYILDNLSQQCIKVYISGDILTNTFGVYLRPYKRYKGSTIEVYALLKKDFDIPREWKLAFLSDKSKKYEVGSIVVGGTKHKINLTIIKNQDDIPKIKHEEINIK